MVLYSWLKWSSNLLLHNKPIANRFACLIKAHIVSRVHGVRTMTRRTKIYNNRWCCCSCLFSLYLAILPELLVLMTLPYIGSHTLPEKPWFSSDSISWRYHSFCELLILIQRKICLMRALIASGIAITSYVNFVLTGMSRIYNIFGPFLAVVSARVQGMLHRSVT